MENERQHQDEERQYEGDSPAGGIEPDEAVPDEATGIDPPQPPGTDHVVEEKGEE